MVSGATPATRCRCRSGNTSPPPCALASVNGAFGFTCGVEWLATERILVHGCTGLAWRSKDNIIPELARLNWLLSHHPCFFDRAMLKRLSPTDSPVFALQRVSAD